MEGLRGIRWIYIIIRGGWGADWLVYVIMMKMIGQGQYPST